MTLFDDELSSYLELCSSAEPELLSQLRKETHSRMLYPQMLSGPVLGRLLKMLIELTGSQRVLEVGMFTGYATLWMAMGLPAGGILHTCEIDPEAEYLARRYFDRSPHGHQIHVHMGAALDTLRGLEGPFDFCFIDADKIHYKDYFERCLELLRSGGLIVIDNTLWYGKVLQPDDDRTKAIDALNRSLGPDERVESVLLAIGDGIQLLRKL